MYTVSSTPRLEPLSVDPVRQAVPGTSVSENIPTSNESTQQNDSHQVCEFSFRGCNWCKDAQGFFSCSHTFTISPRTFSCVTNWKFYLHSPKGSEIAQLVCKLPGRGGSRDGSWTVRESGYPARQEDLLVAKVRMQFHILFFPIFCSSCARRNLRREALIEAPSREKLCASC